MKTFRLILFCGGAFVLASLSGGCAAPQQYGYNSHFDPPPDDPNKALCKDNSQADGLWVIIQYPLWIGAQLLSSH